MVPPDKLEPPAVDPRRKLFGRGSAACDLCVSCGDAEIEVYRGDAEDAEVAQRVEIAVES